MSALFNQVNPRMVMSSPSGMATLPPSWSLRGNRLRGVRELYQEIGTLEQQIAILTKGTTPSCFNKENQHFLLNLFWALGLANQNKISPMAR
jgi:hypothetical protein